MRQIVLVQEEPRGPSQLVEVRMDTAGLGRVAFPDIQQLRTTPDNIIVIKGMRLITPKILTNGVTTGLATSPLAELRKASLVLYCEGWEKAQYIPLLELNDFNDSDAATATTIPFRTNPTKFADWKNVDWSKSYIQYSNGTVSANVPYCFMFDIDYIRINAQGVEMVGPNT